MVCPLPSVTGEPAGKTPSTWQFARVRVSVPSRMTPNTLPS